MQIARALTFGRGCRRVLRFCWKWTGEFLLRVLMLLLLPEILNQTLASSWKVWGCRKWFERSSKTPRF